MKHFFLLQCIFSLSIVFASSTESSAISAENALDLLKQGNGRFSGNSYQIKNINRETLESTAKGQKPFATILSCSDSRLSLEHIFNTGIGEIFVVRVAGNVADTDEIGSIEYGVDHLGTPILLVLGHTACGAVTAVVTGAEVHGSIPALVENIKPAFENVKKSGSVRQDELVAETITENIFQSMKDILTKSEMLRERAKNGKVLVLGALYHLDTGKVEWLGKHPDEAALLSISSSSDGAHGTGHGSEQTSSRSQMFYIASIINLAVMMLFYFIFVSEKRIFQFLKFKARLFFSLLAIPASASALAVFLYLNKYIHTGGGAAFWLLQSAISLLMAAFIVNSHFEAFKKYYSQNVSGLMKQLKEAE